MNAGLPLLPLLLVGYLLTGCLLTGCQSPAPDPQTTTQLAALSARMTALETQVTVLKAAQGEDAAASADDVTARAAAQNCAVVLARTLETFRQGSDTAHYPSMSQLALPDACGGQRVSWKVLDAQHYTFEVTNADGQVLAGESGL
ncbi:hypothetical protein [Deinococcus arenicola]|uniref:Lipoprotein n=1 Tax=Deinococcus arenicola TaxID=2994950 RepID=A0ABU4DSW1_9DEIO|nr:hypothetical protein [Deinococcus sp. ZS9-10]MDV6375522.1 hypothetical protein [Deinococcus sp. ZS9-10]